MGVSFRLRLRNSNHATSWRKETPLTYRVRSVLEFSRRHLSTMPVSKQFLDKLDAARKGQGHAQPGASAEKVLETALDLLLAQQAKRRAEVKKPQKNPRPSKNPGHIPAAVKRAVWSRDEGKCAWPLDSGSICGSTLRLEEVGPFPSRENHRHPGSSYRNHGKQL